ncbi:hypothetical protein G6F43_012627 [Rhizopus delemar]|nr:hypothetical protein G6F43_012627 [Rhizopus delemar]
MQQIQSPSTLSAHTRDSEHSSRHVKQNQETSVRIINSEGNVQKDQSTMGASTYRRVCCQTQPTTTTVLGSELRSRSDGNRCLSTKLENQRSLPPSAMENDSQSITKNQETKTQESSFSNSFMAEPVLVPHDPADETHTTTDHMEAEREMVISRMAIINNFREENGIERDTIEYLNQKIRKTTQRAYDNGWKHWVTWCTDNKKNPCHYSPKNVLSFLIANQKYSNTHLNTLRSAIASVFTIIHPSEQPIAEQPLIKDFFSAKRRSEVRIPSPQQLFTWDITILLQYIKTQLSPSNNLSLQELQVKTILLLCVATMWRPRSDIGQLQHRDIHITQDQQGKFQAIIHARTPKENQVKSTILGEYIEDQLCPVKTLKSFLQRTSTLREKLPSEHTLFLTYLDNNNKQPSSVRPTTVANWIKAVFQEAGIDTTYFQAHSIRSASSTKAVELGHSIQDVKKHANWSLTSNTFEKFYYKPSSQASSSTAINNSIFSTTDNSTVRDKISPFFGFFAMPRREIHLELRFADEKFTSFFNKSDNTCRDCTWYHGPYAGLRPELDGAWSE